MATRKINQMIETVRAQNQKDMEMLYKDVKFNNKLADLRKTKKDEFQKRMEERETRFEEKQKLNNLHEQEHHHNDLIFYLLYHLNDLLYS